MTQTQGWSLLLTKAARLRVKQERTEREIGTLIKASIEAGASWRMVGVALGTTSQAAWERYRWTKREFEQPHVPGQEALFTAPVRLQRSESAGVAGRYPKPRLARGSDSQEESAKTDQH